ncbi:hypothetical protein ACFY04_06245 [Streptomyces sp. NPDC001549]|uniref:hypothetical protein n=1 Tax=Streptomyces sp. NPDC001549 TaxID=3364586 RepID=UPI003673A05B
MRLDPARLGTDDQAVLADAAWWTGRVEESIVARDQLRDQPECEEQCHLVSVETEEAQERGAFAEAAQKASEMAEIARRCGSSDLLAVSTVAQSGVLLAEGRVAEGPARLDDAMCAATAGELSAFFTGWIYRLGLQACIACADLLRAAE